MAAISPSLPIQESIHAHMYLVSEEKKENISRVEEIMQNSSIDFYLNLRRNLQISEDQYRSFLQESGILETSGGGLFGSDTSTSDMLYSEGYLVKLIPVIEEIFRQTNILSMEDLVRLLSSVADTSIQEPNKTVRLSEESKRWFCSLAIQRMLETRTILRNRFNEKKYLCNF
jgi:hypothetical protein